MRQGRVGKGVRRLDLFGRHLASWSQVTPCGQPGGRSDGQRLAARHRGRGVELGLEDVPAFQQAALSLHDAWLGCHVFLHDFFERLHRPLGVERIAGEVKPGEPAALNLVVECRRRWSRIRGGEDRRHVVLGFSLFGSGHPGQTRRLGLLDCVAGSAGRWRRLLPAWLLGPRRKPGTAGENGPAQQDDERTSLRHDLNSQSKSATPRSRNATEEAGPPVILGSYQSQRTGLIESKYGKRHAASAWSTGDDGCFVVRKSFTC